MTPLTDRRSSLGDDLPIYASTIRDLVEAGTISPASGLDLTLRAVLAKGGIVSSRSLRVVGEAGPVLVIPPKAAERFRLGTA